MRDERFGVSVEDLGFRVASAQEPFRQTDHQPSEVDQTEDEIQAAVRRKWIKVHGYLADKKTPTPL